MCTLNDSETERSGAVSFIIPSEGADTASLRVLCSPQAPPKNDDDDDDDVTPTVPAAAAVTPGPSQVTPADPAQPEGMQTDDDGWTVARKRR